MKVKMTCEIDTAGQDFIDFYYMSIHNNILRAIYTADGEMDLAVVAWKSSFLKTADWLEKNG